ncbi:MAG: Flavodoxin reductases (ferredoxin-NADPH reductases) family 1; Vanillate O-demethylase oxidoreductase, partial [uncultured Actinomycetospora sp.]
GNDHPRAARRGRRRRLVVPGPRRRRRAADVDPRRPRRRHARRRRGPPVLAVLRPRRPAAVAPGRPARAREPRGLGVRLRQAARRRHRRGRRAAQPLRARGGAALRVRRRRNRDHPPPADDRRCGGRGRGVVAALRRAHPHLDGLPRRAPPVRRPRRARPAGRGRPPRPQGPADGAPAEHARLRLRTGADARRPGRGDDGVARRQPPRRAVHAADDRDGRRRRPVRGRVRGQRRHPGRPPGPEHPRGRAGPWAARGLLVRGGHLRDLRDPAARRPGRASRLAAERRGEGRPEHGLHLRVPRRARLRPARARPL